MRLADMPGPSGPRQLPVGVDSVECPERQGGTLGDVDELLLGADDVGASAPDS